jgi:hypothetical protein
LDEDRSSKSRQHPAMMTSISPITTTTITKATTHCHHHHPLRTAHSFTENSSLSSPLSIAPTDDTPPSNTTATKVDESSTFSLVGHLRSLSLPSSEHSSSFRKRS